MKRGTLTLLVAGVALALAVPALAAGPGTPGRDGTLQLAQAQDEHAGHHPAPAPDAAAPPGGGMMMGLHHGMSGKDEARDGEQGPRGHFQHMCENADAHHAAMIAFAEVKLKITDAQKPAWAKFTEAAKAAQANLTKLCTLKDQPHPATLPERLARAETVTQARLAHLQTLRPALEELYKELTPEQQKIANSLPLGGHGHHGHHHPM